MANSNFSSGVCCRNLHGEYGNNFNRNFSLAIFFKAEQTTGSIPVAGLALGLNSLAGSFTAGIRGAAIDRWGHKWPIRILVPGYAAGIFMENMATTSTEILVWVFILGISAPPINISIRPLWKQIFPEELVRGAYGVDTALMNSVGYCKSCNLSIN